MKFKMQGGRSFHRSNVVSENIIQIYTLFQQKLINFNNGKKLVLDEDFKFRLFSNQSQNQKETYIKLMKSSYQLCLLDKDFSNLKLMRKIHFRKLNYDQTCTELSITNGIILLLQFNYLVLIRNNKIVQKIKPQSLRLLNQKIFQQLPYLFQPSVENNKIWDVLYEPIIEKFKQYFKINKEPPQSNSQLQVYNDIFVWKRFSNDEFLYLAEFSYLQSKQGTIKKIIIYANDLFLDLTIIKEIISLEYIKYMMSLSQKISQFIATQIRTSQMLNFIKSGQFLMVKMFKGLNFLYEYAYFNIIITNQLIENLYIQEGYNLFRQKGDFILFFNIFLYQNPKTSTIRDILSIFDLLQYRIKNISLKFYEFRISLIYILNNNRSLMYQEIWNANQIDSNSSLYNELLAEDEFICSYKNLIDDKSQYICQLCFKKQLFHYCQQQQFDQLKNKLYQPKKLQMNALTRIRKEIQQFRINEGENIKLFQIQLENGAILMNSYFIFMKGLQNTSLENGIYPFLIQYPNDYPFKPFQMASLFHFYSPSIYKNHQLCIKFNTITKVQTKTLYEMVMYHYENMRKNVPNQVQNDAQNDVQNDLENSQTHIVNLEIKSIYDDNFILMQAKYFSFLNPIYQKWQLEQKWNQSCDQPIQI